MADLKFDVDVRQLSEKFGNLKEQVQKDITKGVENLATMTHAKANELARDELNSLSKKYMDNLEFSNPAPNLWVVTLKEPAMWIEDGRKSGFMEELLSGKSSRQGKNGRYAIVPFEHSKPPTEQSPKAQALAQQIKDALKKEGINWKKIERHEDGSPRIGRLHNINVESARIKPEHKNSPGMGVRVYQTKDPNTGNVRRDVMTFRVITEKHRQAGLWHHPGRQGNKLLDKAFNWAQKTFYKEILPAIFEKYKD